MTVLELNNGRTMPQVGFGLWKVPNDKASDIVYNAIKAGYRLFDGACDYGNEVECGQGVARAIKEGLVKREDLFITSKLWNTYHEAKYVEPICRKQLQDWGLEYFDLFHIHFPIAIQYVDPKDAYPPGWHPVGKPGEVVRVNATHYETWTAFEGLVEKGLAKSIGISNFQGQAIYDLLRHPLKIRPAVLQIEHHPFLVQPELIKLAKAEGIAVTAYSSFGTNSFKNLDFEVTKGVVPLMEDPTITKLAEKYNKKPSQILLRWSTQRGLAVIPKTTRTEVMAENLDCVGFDLSDDDIATISSMNRGLRFNQPAHYFKTEKLWIFA